MAAGRSKSAGWIAFIIIAALAIGGAGVMPVYGRERLLFGRNGNIELLNRLNDTWQLPEGYTLEVREIHGRTLEWVQEKGAEPKRAILQLHGGAYTRSLKDNGVTYRRAAVQYAKLSGAGVLTVDYRVAPEYPYPAALEDALFAYQWLLDQGIPPEGIIIAGDSAGGGLTLALTLYLRDNGFPLPAALITMSPWTNLSYRGWKPPYVGSHHADDPYISPLYGEYDSFPPMLMQVGGDEVLLDDTLQVAQKAEEAGVEVIQTTYPGMFHVFQMLFPDLPEANTAWTEVELFIESVFAEEVEGK